LQVILRPPTQQISMCRRFSLNAKKIFYSYCGEESVLNSDTQ
jgi:hypothetical protein